MSEAVEPLGGADQAAPPGASIEHRYLRSAIEFAVVIAEETQKRKPPMAVPTALRAFFGKRRVPTGALGRLRRAIEADPTFRQRIAAGAVPELVDDVGRLWLQQPENWVVDAEVLIAAEQQRAADADAAKALQKSERRRAAAEEAVVRARAESVRLSAALDEQQPELDRLRADLVKAEEAVAELRAELLDVRNEARHARDREAAAAAKLDTITAERDLARATPTTARGSATDRSANDPSGTKIDDEAMQAILGAARDAADAAAASARLVEALLADSERAHSVRSGPGHSQPGPSRSTPARRRPLPLPGGVIASSAEAAAHLARADASMFVDGYNVAKLGWPRLSLAEQREALIDAVENIVRRFGADVTVVFDGADVVGAHAGRRLSARIVFSPPGVTADDVIRDEISRLPPQRHVVVVTNDAEIARDVRAEGANVLPSNALLALS